MIEKLLMWRHCILLEERTSIDFLQANQSQQTFGPSSVLLSFFKRVLYYKLTSAFFYHSSFSVLTSIP